MQKYIFREIKLLQLKETELNKAEASQFYSYLLLPWSSLVTGKSQKAWFFTITENPYLLPFSPWLTQFLEWGDPSLHSPREVDFSSWNRGLILKNQIKSQPNKLCDLLRIYISFHKKLGQLQYMKNEREFAVRNHILTFCLNSVYIVV